MPIPKARETLSHILHTVFDVDNTDPLSKALQFYGILDFINMSVTTNHELQNHNIPSWQRLYITLFQDYFYWRQEHGTSLLNNWASLTKDDFDQWIKEEFPSFKKPPCQLISSSLYNQRKTFHARVNSPCGELGQIIHSSRTLNHNLCQSEFYGELNQSNSIPEEPKENDICITMSTHQENIDSLQHILNIFDHDADSPLRIAFNKAGIQSISDFITMLPHDIEALSYTDNVNIENDAKPDFTSTTPLQVVCKLHIKILQGYIIYRNNINDPIEDKWTSITSKQIDTYRTSNHWFTYRRNRVPNAMATDISSNQYSINTPAQLEPIIPSTTEFTPHDKTNHSSCHHSPQQHQNDLIHEEPKETNVDIPLSSDLPISDPHHNVVDIPNMCFTSPCGELNKLAKLSTTLNHNLCPSKLSATFFGYKHNATQDIISSLTTNKLQSLSNQFYREKNHPSPPYGDPKEDNIHMPKTSSCLTHHSFSNNLRTSTSSNSLYREINETNPTSGEHTAIYISIPKSVSQNSLHPPDKERRTTIMNFDPLYGEFNQLVRSSTTLNHNLCKSKSSATIFGYEHNAVRIATPPSTTNKLQSSSKDIVPVSMDTLEAYFLKGTLPLYESIPIGIEHQTKSEYLASIEPEPPPYMPQRSSCGTNCFKSCRVQQSVSCNIAHYYGEFIFISFKSHIEAAMIHSYKTKLVMDQLDVQNSYGYLWGAINLIPLKYIVSPGLRQYIYISAVWGVTENTQVFS